ncbi:Autotransporter-associated beta strand repeat protein [Sphingomonas haloaromaticamans]|uniref:Autotransporter-associated beta strand repeat protein n=2 Tax=Edaphosphingomonas haloaromaticamans TaxID=653954 RepID=A0A1S1HEV9_9SPHN|nr:Autotransporter-associated beta strand repeat protein [Sphingomonas haloaromaticamans]
MLCGASLSVLALTGSAVRAADRYWDANGTAVGVGGNGGWNVSSSLWSPSSDGVSGPYGAWTNAGLDRAIFGGTAGTVTLTAPITANALRFMTNNYVLTGNVLTLAGATPTITTDTGVTTTIASVLAGGAGLIKDGPGTLNLEGVNQFSGGVNVLGGGLGFNADAALGAAGNGITLAGGAGLTSNGTAMAASRVVTLAGGQVTIRGAGTGAARYTGAGGLTLAAGITLSNDANDYQGQTRLNGQGTYNFTSIADLGLASALGAPVTAADGTIVVNGNATYSANASYIGGGDSSNRDWQLITGGTGTSGINNQGSGKLTLTGNISNSHAASTPRFIFFNANTADIDLLGTISSNNAQIGVVYGSTGTGRTILVGGVNDYGGASTIQNVTVRAGSLRNAGTASALGTGVNGGITLSNGRLSYIGAGDASNRAFAVDGNGILANDGAGALALSGDFAFQPGGAADVLTLGGGFGGTNTLSGGISGAGGILAEGSGRWLLTGANSYVGTVTVNGGALIAGGASAFGAPNAAIVNGGTLDLNGHDTGFTALSGTGGTVALGGATMTVAGSASSRYDGTISGSGGLVKRGTSTLTLTGANSYAGGTTINGGALTLDFSPAGGPAADILANGSMLTLSGGVLNLQGAAGEANSQSFGGLNVVAGSNRIAAVAGAGGGMTVNLGAIGHSGGLVDFTLTGGSIITTSNTSLGGWATVNGADYAKVVGGQITAFTTADYSAKDDAGTWLNGEFITDDNGNADSFYGTVSGDVQLGGLRYTVADPTPNPNLITIAAGRTLGVDGTIIVAGTVGANNQRIAGGSLTGSAGGGVLGLQQNGGGNFTIASSIVDNGGAIGFTKAGTGLATLTGANSYSGATTLAGGTLAVNSIANGGVASAIGASGADSANLVIESGTLRYTGASATSDRGFTLVNGGPSRGIEVSGAAADLRFNGQVASGDDAGFTKTGAGTLTLGHAANNYVGVTTVNGGTLAASTLANGGIASSIGASGAESANLVLAGGTLNYIGATADTDRGFTLGAGGGGIGVADGGATLTMSGAVIGTAQFRKEGAGTLVLSGANSQSGGIAINGGTLRMGSAQALGHPGNAIAIATGARLELGGYDLSASILTGAGTVDLGGNTLTTTSGSGIFAGRITGTGGFTRGAGSYTQTMNGCANDYVGVTRLNGMVSVDCLADGGQASGIGASGAGSANLVFGGGTLAYTGASVSIDRGFTLTGNGTFNVVNAGTTLEFRGVATGAGALVKSGAGTLLLSGVNTYNGITQIDAGVLRLGSAASLGAGNVRLGNAAGAALDLNGLAVNVRALEGGGAAGGDVLLGSGTMTLTAPGTGTVDFAGAITGSGGVVKGGTYVQTLSGCGSSYGGATTIRSGVLQVSCLTDGGVASSIGASGAGADNLVLDGGTLRYAGAGGSTDRQFTLGATGTLDASGAAAIAFTSSAPITFLTSGTSHALTLTGTNTGNNRLAAGITDSGAGATSLTKTGAGTWILTNAGSSYTGVTRIDGGVLGVDKLADGGLASSLGASSAAAANLVIGNGSTLRYTGAGDTTNRLFTLSAGTTFLESSGTGAIVFTDTGPVTLAGNNQARTIALGGTNADTNILAGSIGDAGTGVTTLAKNDAGTWALTGSNSYSGLTNINAGTLFIGAGGTTGSIASATVNNSGTLGFNRSDSLTYAGLIQGTGRLVQAGGGTTTLSGANAYTGATDVMAGRLLINGNQSAATGLTTVHSGGTLGGSGIIGGSVFVADGGHLAPGNSPGTLTINGDLALDSGAFLDFELGQANVVGGALNDLVEVQGNLTLDGTLTVSAPAGGSFGLGLYRLFNYSGTLTDNGLDVGSGLTVQTAVAGQVNLLNTGGLELRFWDGAAGGGASTGWSAAAAASGRTMMATTTGPWRTGWSTRPIATAPSPCSAARPARWRWTRAWARCALLACSS